MTTRPLLPPAPETNPDRLMVLPGPQPAPGAAQARALLQACRPQQWIKSLLVAAAPVAAGQWWHRHEAGGITTAFLAFVLASSGAYLVNDLADRDRDRGHPLKSRRPIASGRLSAATARSAAVTFLLAAPVLSELTEGPALCAVVTGYEALTVTYSRWLKHIPVLEILVVAAGFLLRPLAGVAATGIPPSMWFLAVCGSGALMVALGKREAELAVGAAHRPVLLAYRLRWLRLAQLLAATSMCASYTMWVVTRAADRDLAAVSAAALAGAAARFVVCARRGKAGAPEALLLHDRVLQVLGAVWLAAFVAGPGRW